MSPETRKQFISEILIFEPETKWYGLDPDIALYEKEMWNEPAPGLTNTLYETVDTTYPTQTTIRYLMNMCHIPSNNIMVADVHPDSEYDESAMIFVLVGCKGMDDYDITMKVKKVNQVMNRCGYRFSKFSDNRVMCDGTEVDYNDCVCLVYSPKFSSDITWEVFNSNVRLLHVSPSYNRDNILKKGLVPRSKNNSFDYPSRIHLLWPVQRTDIVYRMIKDLYTVINSPVVDKNDKYEMMLRDVLGFENTGIHRNIGREGITFDIYGIDKRKLKEPDDLYNEKKYRDVESRKKKGLFQVDKDCVRFFRDPAFQYGVYTYDNIPVDTLILSYKDISIEMIDKYFKRLQ